MNEDKKYNGWTNFETWKINLEVLDSHVSYLIEDSGTEHNRIKETLETNTYDLSKQLKDFTLEVLNYDECERDYPILSNYAYCFIEKVNFHEIAEHVKSDLKEHLAHESKTA